MTRRAWFHLAWLSNRRLARALLGVGVVVSAAIAINAVGIRIVGDTQSWGQWLQSHAGYFLVWRIGLYAGTAYGWCWMRRRLRQREPSAEAHRRLLRVELAAVLALVLLEASVLLRQN
ncbi:hypothetical protein [Paraburkholderia ginsengisoli]|uniref:Uncharacterized protein n=1 Tax=Paraburkholderia ginsengisoli TaxID=311231 RepID=A0A7T4T940_9BURK|nr:hypothetical protein [Paraburkholderia ginsengisoli]QQC64339.1 hypothetical protein I6I06_02245 [Paraburkholderia ginsengisoli]